MAPPAALERPCIHIENQDAFPVNHVNLASILVKVEAPLRSEDVGLLIVLFQWWQIFRWTMAKIPKELSISRELEDAVLRRGSSHPYIAVAVRDDGLQRGWPLRNIARTAPRVDHIAFRV